MDHCRNGIGSVYDTAWACAILRWFGARTQRAQRFHAGIRHRLFNEHPVAGRGLHNRIWIWHIWILGRIGQNVPDGRGCRCAVRYAARGSVFCVSDDFRNHHPRFDRWRLC